ncbi:xanthine dehydrogenase family protein molybdopterin-binding subunit [Sorangium sp. So ce296]|uniref:xanthine dehydrogenase family protein molybdopterin-binding subunit n=1 Tax=Sorangium sp. So ce296 TaxID=3133296 RepID=UPI003F61EF77
MSVSRRDFLQVAAGSAAGLLLSFYVPQGVRAAPKAAQPQPLSPNAFVRIGTDESVTVVLAHSEMGQGIWTGLAMLIAEELECDWSKVRSEHAPAAPVYGHPVMHFQMTGGSTSTNGEFDRYRTVGAMAKDMLVRAAAARWKVAPAACVVAKGVVTHGKDQLTYGQLAEEAMKLTPPAKVKLKDPKDWKLIGTLVRRIDTPEKITGKAQFGIDVQFPGLRTAVVLRPPAFGAKLAKYDAADALKVPGVEKVVPTANGVAVVAAHFWAAKLGRDALRAEWTKPEGGGADSARLIDEFRAQARKPGPVAHQVGKVEDALAAAKSRIEAEYDVPYLAHAPMEPLNCTVKIEGDRCEIWTGTQFQTGDQMAAAKILGTTPEKVQIHTTFLGGGFGRRASPVADFVGEAVMVAKAAGVPVKVVWTREDDMRGGYYRPAYVHRVQVGVDGRGMPTAWDHMIVGQSIVAGTPLESLVVKNGIDHTSVEGVGDSPYLAGMPALRVSLHSPRTPVTVLWWRSVGNTHTAFAMESMVDELAHAAGQDPLAYRLDLLKDKPRHANALKVAAEKAGWGTALPPGRARGLAMHESFGSIVAEVAEVSIEKGRIRVHSVTCSVDCGTAVNPLGIEAQVQGSVAFGLTAALFGKLNIVEGQVQESNFHDYPMLRMADMPRIAVHIIPSKATMGGIGEPATAPIAPAVANAVFALTKQRLRSLPFRLA